MTHAYRRCRQARAKLVRWQRQLLTLGSGTRFPVNDTAFVTMLSFALCPSDGQNSLTQASAHSGLQFGRVNYVASSGAIPIEMPTHATVSIAGSMVPAIRHWGRALRKAFLNTKQTKKFLGSEQLIMVKAGENDVDIELPPKK